MLGTKLFLLSFVVYVSGQDVSYHGSSNVRTQSRLPPRPLYRPHYAPYSEPLSPVYNPQPPPPLPDQATPELQPVYQPPGPPVSQPSEQLASQPPLDRRQLTYWPDSHSPMIPEREPIPETPAPEMHPQPIYSPEPQPAPRPINSRPLQAWSWKSPQSTETPAENTTPINENTQFVNPESSLAPPSYGAKAMDLEPEIESTSRPVPEESVLLQTEADNELPSLSPEISPSDIEINHQPERVPEPSGPELELTTPSAPEPRPIPEELLTDPIPNPEQSTLYPPRPPPPTLPYPLPPTLEPVISPEPKPIFADSVIPPQPETTPAQPNYQPLAPLEPVAAPVYLPTRPNLPAQPPRPNYRPIPHEPVTPSTSQPFSTLTPYAPRPNYKPVSPLVPRPLPAIPNSPPLPSYEPLIPPTPYPAVVVPSQPPLQPTTSYPVVIPTSNVPSLEPEIISITLLADFQCSKGNGYYTVVNECDTYIKCQNQRAYKHSCPDGLHFNPQALYPEYPCAYPSEVKCESAASKQIARPTNQCPNRYGFFLISGGDCSKYLMCQEGMATLMNCPYGLVFNEYLSSCDWPENVPQCNSNAFKDFTCPIPQADDPDVLTRLRYGSDCRRYVACQRGHPRLLSCDTGLSFDENSQVCIDSDLVPSCRITNQY